MPKKLVLKRTPATLGREQNLL